MLIIKIILYLSLLEFIDGIVWTSTKLSNLPNQAGHSGAGGYQTFYLMNLFPDIGNASMFMSYSTTLNKPTVLTPRPVPVSRNKHAMAVSADGLIAVLHGGIILNLPPTPNELRNDVFVLDILQGLWTSSSPVFPSAVAPQVAFHAMTFDVYQNLFYIHGGLVSKDSILAVSSAAYYINITSTGQIYQYKSSVDIAFPAFPVFGHSMVYHSDIVGGNSMFILHGGLNDFNRLNNWSAPSTPFNANIIFVCNMIPVLKTIANCTTQSYPFDSGVNYRFGHRSVMNPQTNEMYVVGGIENFGSSPPNKVSVLYVPDSTNAGRTWTIDNPISRSVCEPALFTFRVGNETMAIVRHGGSSSIDWCKSTDISRDVSLTFDSSADMAFFYQGRPPNYPQFVTVAATGSRPGSPAASAVKKQGVQAQLQLSSLSSEWIIGLSVTLSSLVLGSFIYYLMENPQLLHKFKKF